MGHRRRWIGKWILRRILPGEHSSPPPETGDSGLCVRRGTYPSLNRLHGLWNYSSLTNCLKQPEPQCQSILRAYLRLCFDLVHMKDLPLIARARSHSAAIAFRTPSRTHTYREILDRSAVLASALLGEADDLKEARVALLAPAGFEYVAGQWAIWRAGGIKVPLCLSATEPEWEYSLTDSGACVVMADSAMSAKIGPLCGRLGCLLYTSPSPRD